MRTGICMMQLSTSSGSPEIVTLATHSEVILRISLPKPEQLKPEQVSGTEQLPKMEQLRISWYFSALTGFAGWHPSACNAPAGMQEGCLPVLIQAQAFVECALRVYALSHLRYATSDYCVSIVNVLADLRSLRTLSSVMQTQERLSRMVFPEHLPNVAWHKGSSQRATVML